MVEIDFQSDINDRFYRKSARKEYWCFQKNTSGAEFLIGNSDTGIRSPQHDDTALVIVTYNPDDSFYDRAKLAIDQFKFVIVVDNTGPEGCQLLWLQYDSIQVIKNKDNLGLGHALNTGCQRALELGFRWVVTLDQDTDLSANFLTEMLSAWSGSKRKPAVFGCNYYNVSRSQYRFPPSNTPLVMDRKTVITSGCLMHLPTWSYLGCFKSDYFIDAIDHEFCLRARSSGYCVAVNFQSLMVHTIGEEAKYHKFLGKYSPYTHSVWRVYTSTRNTTRTIIEYVALEPAWCLRQIAGLSYDLLAVIFLEPEKVARLRAFITGLVHGCRNKMGAPRYDFVANKSSKSVCE